MRRVALLTGVAFALRLALALAVPRSLGAFNDEIFYHHAADTLAHGDGFRAITGGPMAQWPPGYSFVLSLVYLVTGAKPAAGQVLNAVFCALTVPLLFILVRRVLGRREAWPAAGALAVLPGQILWSDVLIAETFYAFLLVAFFVLAAWLPDRPWSALALGVAVGVLTLTRGEGLLLVPVAIAIWWPELPRGRLAARTGLLLAAAVLTVAPWTIRNAVVMDAFIPVSSNASITFYSGHNPRADGAQNFAPAYLNRGLPAFGPRREVEQAKLLRRKGLEFMEHHPGRELELIPLKLFNLGRGDWHAMEWVNAPDKQGARPIAGKLDAPIRVLADGTYYVLLAATLVSLFLFRRELWRLRIVRGVLVLFAATLVMYGFVYYGNFRYRAPLEPLMLLVAAPLLVRIWDLRSSAGIAPP